MDATHAIETVKALTPEVIRQRIAELDAEQEALRILLRSALAKQRAKERDRKLAEAGR